MLTKPSDNPKTIGAYVRAKRIAAGLSLRAVADAIGVSHVFLGEVERGNRLTLKRERYAQLEGAIPGFSANEAERIASETRPIQLSLEDAPPVYKDLGLALARRIDRRDLNPSDINKLMRILRGTEADDE